MAQALDRAVVEVGWLTMNPDERAASRRRPGPRGSAPSPGPAHVEVAGQGGSRRGARTADASCRRRRPVPRSGGRGRSRGAADRLDDGRGQCDLALEPGGIAGSWRQDDARRCRRKASAGRIVCGRTRTRAPRRRRRADDVGLEPESTIPMSGPPGSRRSRRVSVRPRARPGRRSPGPPSAVRRRAGSTGRLDRRAARRRRRSPRRQPAFAGAAPGPACRRPRSPGCRVVAEEWTQLAGIIEDRRRRVGDDERPEPGRTRLVLVQQPAVVADQRVGHDHDLARVRGVGADLLVAGLARVDDEVAAGRDGRTEGDARERVPSSSASKAGPRSPIRGSTTAEARGAGGAITRRARSGRGLRGKGHAGGAARKHPRGPWTVIEPPSRPHGTGTPASPDRL